MSYKFKTIFIPLALMFLFLSSSAKDKRPEWIKSIPAAKAYYHGIGIATASGNSNEDRNKADQFAIEQIILQISSTVNIDITQISQENNNENEQSENSFTKISSQFSVATIKNIRIKDRYFDKRKNLYYSCAILSKADLEQQFKNIAEKAKDAVFVLHKKAQNAIHLDDYSTAYKYYTDAMFQLLQAQALIKEKIYGVPPEKTEAIPLQVFLSDKFNSILSHINIDIISGDSQNAQRNQGLDLKLEGQIYFRNSKDQKIPLSYAILTANFTNAGGKLDSLITSFSNGKYALQVARIDRAESDKGNIRVSLDPGLLLEFEQDIPNLISQIKSVSVNYTFHIASKTAVKIFVHIYESIDDDIQIKSKTTSALIKTLIKNKFTVFDARKLKAIDSDDLNLNIEYENRNYFYEILKGKTDYAIIGFVQSCPGEDTGSGLVFASASASIGIIDIEHSKFLSTVTLNDIEGDGSTSKSAQSYAMDSCREQLIKEILDGLNEAFK